MISGYLGHYYFLLNGEFIVDKCPVEEGQTIDGIYVRKLNYTHIDIQTDSYVFEGDVLYNMQTHQFEISSHPMLKRNFIFQKGIRNIFQLSSQDCIFIYE